VLRRFISTGNELRTPVTKDEIVSEVPIKLQGLYIFPDFFFVFHDVSTLTGGEATQHQYPSG
jgi:large subunit ribosomal protein L9